MPSAKEESQRSLTLESLASERRIEFAWLWLQPSDAISIGRAVQLGSDHSAFIDAFFPPIVPYWFGAMPHFPHPSDARMRFVVEAERQFGAHAKLYHGMISARVENVGSKTRFGLTVTSGDRASILSALSELSLGHYSAYAKKG
jgi:hypothetical protein